MRINRDRGEGTGKIKRWRKREENGSEEEKKGREDRGEGHGRGEGTANDHLMTRNDKGSKARCRLGYSSYLDAAAPPTPLASPPVVCSSLKGDEGDWCTRRR